MRALAVLSFILVTVAPLAGQAPRWSATRDLRIGDVDDPEYTLTWTRSILLDRSGNIYALHPSENLVRVFGPDGRLRLKCTSTSHEGRGR